MAKPPKAAAIPAPAGRLGISVTCPVVSRQGGTTTGVSEKQSLSAEARRAKEEVGKIKTISEIRGACPFAKSSAKKQLNLFVPLAGHQPISEILCQKTKIKIYASKILFVLSDLPAPLDAGLSNGVNPI